MKSTIDAAGRIVVPKMLRDRLGLSGGAVVDIRERKGRLEIEPAPVDMTLVKRPGAGSPRPRPSCRR